MNSDMQTKLYVDNQGLIQYERTQNVDNILDYNKHEINTDSSAKTKFARKTASVPNIVIEQWMKEGINPFLYGVCPETTKRIKQKLNDRENLHLRTHNSRM